MLEAGHRAASGVPRLPVMTAMPNDAAGKRLHHRRAAARVAATSAAVASINGTATAG